MKESPMTTIPPCHADDDRLPAAVREADAMLGMWAELFRQRRTVAGLEDVLDLMPRTVGNLPVKEIRVLLYAALIQLTEPAADPDGEYEAEVHRRYEQSIQDAYGDL